MDDGYWDALLQEADSEATIERASWQDDEELEGALLLTPQGEGGPGGVGGTSSAEELADWRQAAVLLASGEVLSLAIAGFNRGGLIADYGSIQGFLPASHLLVSPSDLAPAARMRALAARVGEALRVRVIEIDYERRRLILSERCAADGDLSKDLLSSLAAGQVRSGPVTKLCPFGAFVDLGGFEGLIHISEMSWSRVGSAEEVVRPGDQVNVLVLDVNPRAKKVALSLKRLLPDPWQGVNTRYHVGQALEAVITNVVSFGAFARLESGLEGLIHISELAEGSFMHPRNIVNEGDRVRVRVLHVDGAKHRVALSMRCGDTSGRGQTAAPPRDPGPA